MRITSRLRDAGRDGALTSQLALRPAAGPSSEPGGAATSLSIVIPTYRGGHSLRLLLPALAVELGRHPATARATVEVVVVDDASGPRHLAGVRAAVAASATPARLIELPRRSGQQRATIAGVSAARGAVIVTMDDDRAHPPCEVARLVEVVAGGAASLVYAAPRSERRAPLRRLGTALNNLFFHLAFGVPAGIRIGSFRAFDAALARRALARPAPWPYLSAMLLQQRPALAAVRYRADAPADTCASSGAISPSDAVASPRHGVPGETTVARRYHALRLAAIFLGLVWHWGVLRGRRLLR